VLRRLDDGHYPHQALTEAIIGAAIEVHRALGPGFLECVYEHAMIVELRARGLQVTRQVEYPVLYRGQQVGKHVADLIVDGSVLVELKRVDDIHPIHRAQVISSLRAANVDVGLLINFNVTRLKHGVVRLINPRLLSVLCVPQCPNEAPIDE